MPDTLSLDDLAYYQTVYHQALIAQGAHDSFTRHLAQKYAFQAGDQLTRDGQILRAQPAPKVDNDWLEQDAAKAEP